MAKTKYKVWIAFENYVGKLIEKETVAIFYSKNRAEEYLEWCNAECSDGAVYGIEYNAK